MDLLTSLVPGLTKLTSKTSIASRKCTLTSLNLSQHSRRNLMHMIVLCSNLFIHSVFINYMRIYLYYSLFFSWSMPWERLEFRIPISSITIYPLNYKTDSMMPPITGGKKSDHGFSHTTTGKLLCPLRYLDRF